MCPVSRCRRGLRRDLSGSALPTLPQSVSRGARLSRLHWFAFATACQVARPPGRIGPSFPGPPGTFTSRLPAGRSPFPSLDMTTTATGLLCWRDFHPQEWQLASLHRITASGSPSRGFGGRSPAMSLVKDPTRRTLLKGAGGLAALAGIGAPAIVKAQADGICIGHLTPRTGFLGPLGEYAVMAAQMAADEVNAGGGVMGRKIELLIEDSVNPQTASAKAERLVERDKVAAIVGEISSASGLAIAQVVQRAKVLFINTGCNSDALRVTDCKKFMFHIEGANSMYVKAAGQAIDKMGLVKAGSGIRSQPTTPSATIS